MYWANYIKLFQIKFKGFTWRRFWWKLQYLLFIYLVWYQFRHSRTCQTPALRLEASWPTQPCKGFKRARQLGQPGQQPRMVTWITPQMYVQFNYFQYHCEILISIVIVDFIIIALAPCSGLDICLFMLLTIPVVSLRSSCGVTALLLTFFFRSFSWTFREPCRARRGEANAAASGRPSRRSAQVFGTTVEASSRLRRRPAPRLAVCTSSKVYRHCTLPANMLRLTIIL